MLRGRPEMEAPAPVAPTPAGAINAVSIRRRNVNTAADLAKSVLRIGMAYASDIRDGGAVL
jgi:hypothetical protein